MPMPVRWPNVRIHTTSVTIIGVAHVKKTEKKGNKYDVNKLLRFIMILTFEENKSILFRLFLLCFFAVGWIGI